MQKFTVCMVSVAFWVLKSDEVHSAHAKHAPMLWIGPVSLCHSNLQYRRHQINVSQNHDWQWTLWVAGLLVLPPWLYDCMSACLQTQEKMTKELLVNWLNIWTTMCYNEQNHILAGPHCSSQISSNSNFLVDIFTKTQKWWSSKKQTNQPNKQKNRKAWAHSSSTWGASHKLTT